MKNGQNLKLGDAHVTPRNIQEVQALKLGDARASPSSSTKISGPFSIRYIFIASYIMCCSWSVIYFVFSFVLFSFCFVCCNKQLDPSILVWERETRSVLIAQNALVFALIVLRLFQFASTAFSSWFSILILFRACQFYLFMYDQLSGLY